MVYVAVKQFRDNLSKYLNQVANGRSLLITKCGKVVAKVIPYDGVSEVKALEDRLAGSVKFYKNPTDPIGLETEMRATIDTNV